MRRAPAGATAWPFITPLLVLLTAVAGWPLGRTIWFSFTDATLGQFDDYRFLGLDNYLASQDGVWFGVLTDPVWWRSVWNTLWFTGVSVSLETGLGIIVAAVVLIPWAIPTVVSARMWSWMLPDLFGVITDALLRIGAISAPIAWTADPDIALWAVVMVDVWKTTPFVALLVLAALQMLPEELYEAARLDGAGPIRTFISITLPLIRPALLVAVIFRALETCSRASSSTPTTHGSAATSFALPSTKRGSSSTGR